MRKLTLALVLLGVFAGPVRADWVCGTVAVGYSPTNAAVNPVTNRIYVTNQGDASVTIIDGATNATTSVATGSSARTAAVNPVTNKIYVVCGTSASVSVIDGATNSVTTVPVGTTPMAVAVNPVTNKIYVANNGSASVTVIDGATNATTSVATGGGPRSVAVNPVTNKIYVASSGSASVTVIDGATNATTAVPVGSSPWAVAVNPVTNKIHVANLGDSSVTVIDGATNSTTAVRVAAHPWAIAINPVTNKIYLTHDNSNRVTVIDGATNTTTAVTVGANPTRLAVNPVTNKIYVPNRSSNRVTVIDGATNDTATLATGNSPYAAVVNPVTNRVYVVCNNSNNVTVIDGASYGRSLIGVGSFPYVAAINPVTNKIYVTCYGSHNVTIIDGATGDTTTVPAGFAPYAAAVNPVTDKVYVTDLSDSSLMVIDGATNDTSLLAVGGGPIALAVNPATNRIYVANSTDNSVTVVDGATNATTTVAAGSEPQAIAVNPATNKVYVANYSGNTVTVIDGATHATLTVAVGSGPKALAVNPVTNRIYVVNRGSNDVTVIDGATNATTTVAVGSSPQALAVNPMTNRVYVLNNNNLTVIDGVANTTSTVAVNVPRALAVNPVTNKIYVARAYGTIVIDGITNDTVTVSPLAGTATMAVNPVTNQCYVVYSNSALVAVITPDVEPDIQVRAAFVDGTPNVVDAARPGLAGKGVNRRTPNRTRIELVGNRAATVQAIWNPATITGGAGSDSVTWSYEWGADSLIWGENLLCAYALESDGATTNNTGLGSPSTGNLLVRPMYRVPADVGCAQLLAPTGSIDSGTAITPACTVVNYGAVPASYTVRMRIGSYDQAVAVTSHAPGTRLRVTFPDWTATEPGVFTVTCSTELAIDGNRGNDRVADSVVVPQPPIPPGWQQLASLPAGPKAKNVKDGGALAFGDEGQCRLQIEDCRAQNGRIPDSDRGRPTTNGGGTIYALKGNGRYEFYRYSIEDNTWATVCSIPAIGRAGKKKPVKKGSAMTAAGGLVYGAKGNNSLEWWAYDPTANSWTQKADVPTGAKNLKEGTGAVAVTPGDTGYVYLLRGAGTQDFHRYNITTDAWENKAPASLGASGKYYKNGSALATNGITIWALKGSYNELAAYDIATDAWTTKTGLPLIGSGGKKKKVKDGAGLAYANGLVYGLKGGNTRELWVYAADSDRWTQTEDMPVGGGKNVKGGGGLVAADGALYALKGNNTLEFFEYVFSADLAQASSFKLQAQSGTSLRTPHSALRISPNPFSTATTISYSLPTSGIISLKLYDITGKLVTTLAEGHRNAGASSFKLQASSLSGGIYIIRLETETSTTTTKLIVE